MGDPSRVDLRSLMARAEAAAPVGTVDAVAAGLLEALDAHEVSFLIADFSGRTLSRLGHVSTHDGRDRETSEPVELIGTPHGEALARQQSVLVPEGAATRVLAPVTSRGEAVGVLELLLPFDPEPATLEDVELAAHQLAYLVIANRRFTDLYEWGQRTVPLSLAAEIQRRLLPATYTCEAGQFTLAGWLEPAGQVGGDTFDFSLERDALHLSITDAMGHSVSSALLATILVGSLRNTRRRLASLTDQAQHAHQALVSHAAPGGFVTGQLVRVDLVTQTAEIINAGHPPPFLVRGDRVEQVPLLAELPFGALDASSWSAQTLPLEPGDRLVFVSDGVLERQANGVDVLTILAQGRDLHPREAVQHLMRAVVEAAGGTLEDDAAALCLDWFGGPPRDRVSHAGAAPTSP
jgi:serine phosphatase RsbU (regulator of sigma subunit)